MNCRHFNKFISSCLNYRSISSQNHAKTEQLYSCFQKDPIENLRSLKFVPKEIAPKIPARIYHEASQQMKISKRIVGLQNPKLGSDLELLTRRLKNLMQVNQPSLMNFSTRKIVETRYGKSASKHNIGLSGSSSRSSFVQKPNGLLQKMMLSYSDLQSKRYASTESLQLLNPNLNVNHQKKKILTSSRTRKDNQSLLLKAKKESLTRIKDKNGTISKNSNTPSELLLNIRDRLEVLSISINKNLMKIDSSLKDKINVMKAKFNKAAAADVETPQTENAFKIPLPQYTDEKRIYKTNLQLMPMKAKTSFLAEINNYTQSLDFDPKKSVLARLPSYSPKVRLRRDLTSVDSADSGREYVHQFLEPFKISGQLMEKPDKSLSSMRNQILGITLKNSADADGVYLVSKKMNKTNHSVSK